MQSQIRHAILSTAMAMFFFFAAYARAQDSDGYWSKNGGGSWANAANWDSGVIADGEDNTAYFGLSIEPTIPASATFTLDSARTIGNLFFTAQSGPDNWTFNTGSGGPLTLDATFDFPTDFYIMPFYWPILISPIFYWSVYTRDVETMSSE